MVFFSRTFIFRKLLFTHLNLVKAGYKDKMEGWLNSSVIEDLGGKTALVKVHLL